MNTFLDVLKLFAMNILTDQVSDFHVVDTAVRKFEAVSGAILSRNKKC